MVSVFSNMTRTLFLKYLLPMALEYCTVLLFLTATQNTGQF